MPKFWSDTKLWKIMDFWSRSVAQSWHLLTIEALQPLTSVLLSKLNCRGERKNCLQRFYSRCVYSWKPSCQRWCETGDINYISTLCVKIVNTRQTFLTASYCLWTNPNFPSLRRRGNSNASVTKESAVPFSLASRPVSPRLVRSLQSRRACFAPSTDWKGTASSLLIVKKKKSLLIVYTK